MTRAGAMIRGGGVGAAAMYFLDPDSGRRRRALVRDQLEHWATVVREEITTEMRDVQHRTQGAAAKVRQIGTRPPMNDEAIKQRILGRLQTLDRPDGIDVLVHGGRVHLRGPVLARDAERARRLVRRVHGARELVDELEIHGEPDVPALQARQRPRNSGEPVPAVRLVTALLAMAAARPIARAVGPVRTARMLAVSALGGAVYTVERARVRAVARGRSANQSEGVPT